MTPVDQTRFGCPGGNCFRACVASILEIPLAEAPDLMHLAEWFRGLEAWLAPRGLYPVCFTCKSSGDWTPAGLHLLSGRSPRGAFDHSVIARGNDIVHDPHPDRTGLLTKVHRILLVPIDPAAGGTH